MNTRWQGWAALAFGLLSAPAMAAQFWVSNASDSGLGSLRQAILDMNAAPGDSHQIWFDLIDPGVHIVLHSSLPIIDKPQVLITGIKSPEAVIINGVGQYAVFRAPNGSRNRELRISGLEIRNGAFNADAACIAAAIPPGDVIGILDLRGVVIRDCASTAVNLNGTGGAVRADRRHVEIAGSRFEGNRVQGTGGALLVRGGGSPVQLTVRNSTFIDNGAEGIATVSGGAIAARDVRLEIVASRFLGNWTRLIGSPPAALDLGAAIHATSTGGKIHDSLFYAHSAGSSTVFVNNLAAEDILQVSNTQFVGNEVGRGANIWAEIAALSVRNTSFLGTTTADLLRPTAIFQYSNLVGVEGGMAIHNSLFGRSNAPADAICGHQLPAGAITTQGDNQVVSGSTPVGCGLIANTNLFELAIEALRNNGGPVETVSMFADSSALDAGSHATPGGDNEHSCLAADARGVPRPQPGSAGATPRCDVGAWESRGEPPLFRHDFEDVLWRP